MAEKENPQKSGGSRRTNSKRRYYRRKKDKTGKPKSAADATSKSGEAPAKNSANKQSSGKESPGKKGKSSRSSRGTRAGKSTAKSARKRRSSRESRQNEPRSGQTDSEQMQARERRRRRRRSRPSRTDNRPSIVETISREYSAPEEIVVYSHVLRPDSREPYEFRSEAFKSTGSRDISDFRVDLSVLFPHILDPMTPEEEAVAERRVAEKAEAAEAWKAAWKNTPEEDEAETIAENTPNHAE